jgi:hypothetical protein
LTRRGKKIDGFYFPRFDAKFSEFGFTADEPLSGQMIVLFLFFNRSRQRKTNFLPL